MMIDILLSVFVNWQTVISIVKGWKELGVKFER